MTTETPARCAFAHCQAGGDILPGAPFVVPWHPPTEDPPDPYHPDPYHPGCWAAEQRGVAR